MRIDLAFDDAFLALPDDADHVIIPQGNRTADVALIPLAIQADLQVTARYDGVELTAEVDVLEGAPLASVIDVMVPANIVAGEPFTIDITIDQAAPEEGLIFEIRVVPENTILGDLFPFMDPGARELNALYTAGFDLGPVMIEVSSAVLPGVVGMAQTEIIDALPGAELVINEVDYDQAGEDTLEFLELYNTGDAPVQLGPLVVEMVNGSNDQGYGSYPLADAGAEIAPGGFLIIGNPNVIAGLADDVLRIEMPLNGLQNGPDGVRIVNMDRARLEGFSYEGFLPDVTEGGAFDGRDAGGGSLGRCPNGADTDDNSVDFRFMEASTPGVANVCAPPAP